MLDEILLDLVAMGMLVSECICDGSTGIFYRVLNEMIMCVVSTVFRCISRFKNVQIT